MDKQNNGFITLMYSCQDGGIRRILIEGEGRGWAGMMFKHMNLIEI